MTSRFSSNSEANASELQENLEGIYLVTCISKYEQITWIISQQFPVSKGTCHKNNVIISYVLKHNLCPETVKFSLYTVVSVDGRSASVAQRLGFNSV